MRVNNPITRREIERGFSEQVLLGQNHNITGNIGEIDRIASENGVIAVQNAQSATTLKNSSEQLRNSISRFMV